MELWPLDCGQVRSECRLGVAAAFDEKCEASRVGDEQNCVVAAAVEHAAVLAAESAELCCIWSIWFWLGEAMSCSMSCWMQYLIKICWFLWARLVGLVWVH